MTELAKKFDFKQTDEKWCRFWVDQNLFHAQANPKKRPYCITIPPPNVTGILHMGHALNNTLQDIIVRYKRMKGFETLWMAGTDHAGIATQNVVEKKLTAEGITRQEIGREAFLDRLWAWKQSYGDAIIHQLEKLGASCDWPRARFTMDEKYSGAVKYVFVELYKKGLIYQGEYIINWCPRCHTALSDEEAEHQEHRGKLYHFRYPLKDSKKGQSPKGDTPPYVVVATTRPETMLGDTAVAVNPRDKRYKKLIGKKVILPLMEREMEIIADDFVDPEFGTGAVKVTPAHDPNDFAMGQRHKLPFINIFTPDAKLNNKVGKFEGLDRFEGRKKVIEQLDTLGLIEKIEDHTHAVGHCYRCDTVVEPYLSKQWFVKMKPLADPAAKAVRNGKIKFHPDRWSKVYLNWMDNIRDWCISRQIWWGHRIPVWYCVGDDHCKLDCKKPIVSMETPTACPHCGSANLKQDEDVLDTWFSSWLWPFATFQWPDTKKDPDLKYFYPTSALFTASEIIFFWVARMVMAGLEFMGDIPFSDVYIHGTVRDAKGQKMSKSLGNALDPLEIIDEYGVDALRFSLIINSGQDLYISKEKFEIGRNFANKIWNASRLILMNVKKIDPAFEMERIKPKDLDLPSRWIISKLYTTIAQVGEAIERYRYSEAESQIYDFFWGQLCDWYLEIIKDRWDNPHVQNTALGILVNSLKIMHPFMPVVTEEIWNTVYPDKDPVSLQAWPAVQKKLIDKDALDQMQTVVNVVTALRNLRASWNVAPKEALPCLLASRIKKTRTLLEENKGLIQRLVNLREISITDSVKETKNIATAIVGEVTCALPLGDVIDIDKEKTRILAQIEEQKKAYSGIEKRLQNKSFLNKAPQEVVEKEKARMKELVTKNTELEKVIANLK